MRLVRSCIGIRLENSDLRGMVLYRDGIQRQHPGLDPNRSLDLFLQCGYIAVQLSGIDLQLGQPYDTALPRFGRWAAARPEQTGGDPDVPMSRNRLRLRAQSHTGATFA